MGNKAKQKKNYLELLSLKDDPFKQYLETLPEMIEEHKIMRKMKGSDVILELNAQGKTAEAMVYEPNKVYDRIYTTLRKMDHLANAKKAFAKFSYAYLNLPFFFRPVVRGKEDSKVFLEFAKPSNMSKEAKKKRDTHTDDYLNTKIDFQPTNEGSYDGQKMFRYLADEASKWTKGRSFLNHWGQVSPTMDEGGKIVGKAFVGSTVAAMKDGLLFSTKIGIP